MGTPDSVDLRRRVGTRHEAVRIYRSDRVFVAD